MRTVYIMVEGPTEEEFIKNSLSNYLGNFGILNAVPILLETSPGFFGGDVTFERYKTNAENLLISDPNAIVTSLIDYYELRKDFPGYEDSFSIVDKNARIDFLESQITSLIINERFLPYIQLHEFEALLFSDIKGFGYITKIRPDNMSGIQYVINNFKNPELINDTKENAPSARLAKLIPRYKKTFHGPIIALENGVESIISKCPRFKNWIETIIHKTSTL